MAMYDHRTFRWQDKWWVAEIHGGSGAGWGAKIPTITRESVYFTCISDEDEETRSADIAPGELNRLGHAALGTLLEGAKPFGSRFDMYPYNMPDAEQLQRLPQVVDDDGLRWVYRKADSVMVKGSQPVIQEGMELLCLDDSALKGTIPFADGGTRDDFLSLLGEAGIHQLISLLKSRYLEK